MKCLADFLQYLIEHPILRGSSYLTDFLSIGEDEMFKIKQKEWESSKPLNRVSE